MHFLHHLLSSGCLGLLACPWFYLLVILAVEMDSVGLEATQEGNIGWGFLIRISSYIFFLSGCDLRSCFVQWTGLLFQTHNTIKHSQRAWSYPETSGCESGRSSWAKPPKRDLPLMLQVLSVSFLLCPSRPPQKFIKTCSIPKVEYRWRFS